MFNSWMNLRTYYCKVNESVKKNTDEQIQLSFRVYYFHIRFSYRREYVTQAQNDKLFNLYYMSAIRIY
jgi:hypothetical protein